MSITGLCFLLASALYTGFQWTIRVVVYPQFAAVPADGFREYERRHQRQVSFAVGPLFVALGLSALAVVVNPPASVPVWLPPLGLVLVGAVLAITAVFAVPQHRRLSHGFDDGAYRRLLAVDSARLVAALAATVVAVALVV